MFPKVLLQWCAAISSCAAEIGKLLHSSATSVCLLCQQATCAVRLWPFAATATLSPAIRTLAVVWPTLVQSGVTIKWCWAAGLFESAETQHRVMPPPYYDAAVSLSKASLCFCRAHGCSSCFSHPISICSPICPLQQQVYKHTDICSTLGLAAKRSNNTSTKSTISPFTPADTITYSLRHTLRVHTPSTTTHACSLLVLCWLESDGTKGLFWGGQDISERVGPALSPSGRKPTACWSHWRQLASLPLSQYCLSHSLWFYTAGPGDCGFTHMTHISAAHQKTSGSALWIGADWGLCSLCSVCSCQFMRCK